MVIENRASADSSASPSLAWDEILVIARRRWRRISLLTGVLATLGLVIGLVMTPVYRCTTTLIASDSNDKQGILGAAMGQLGGLASLSGLGLGIGGGSQNGTNEALAVLQSRQFLEEFISSKGLLPKIFADQWDSQSRAWKAGKKVPTLYKGYRKFAASILDVYQDKKNNLITLGVDWRDRQEGTAWANELVERVNERMRERAVNEADQSIKYLDAELRSAEGVDVRLALSSMLASQLKTKALAATRKQYAFRVVDPASPVDEEFRLRPHKAIYAIVGAVVGLLAGVALAFLTASHRKTSASLPS